ncbi:hypothetical protein VNO80_02758 [Phaseolus coccineus]|uniref:Uncharacterized protein n=1 Tax=Phaseolus coccineus TaxID=3886 RepID=A0AAN9NS03_PHACN
MLREKANELTQQQRVLSEKGETKMDENLNLWWLWWLSTRVQDLSMILHMFAEHDPSSMGCYIDIMGY